MAYTTVLAECLTCKDWTDCWILDCEACAEAWVDAGNEMDDYDGEGQCPHLRCTVCEADLD